MICGKVIYNTRNDAANSLIGKSHFTRANESRKKPTEIYFCADCNGWHLATRGKVKKKKFIVKDKPEIVTKNPPDKLVIGKNQQPLIIHDIRTFKVK